MGNQLKQGTTLVPSLSAQIRLQRQLARSQVLAYSYDCDYFYRTTVVTFGYLFVGGATVRDKNDDGNGVFRLDAGYAPSRTDVLEGACLNLI